MAYRLKSIRYENEGYRILLQNENGPCPLIAAANVLLLKKLIALPSNCIGSGVVTIEELTNILAEKILTNTDGENGSDHHIDDVMRTFPRLQKGMDVNLKFTSGPTGVESTVELTAFVLLKVDLVHGWLLEPGDQEYEWVGDNTYNQLLDLIAVGNEASDRLEHDDLNYDQLSNQATRGTIISNFLIERSATQLTQHGLVVLHEFVKDGDMVVFFRNNHFNTLTKQKDNLYLLVTDIGYADANSVIWEKLDVIDGDTEYVTAEFKVSPRSEHHVSEVATGEQLVANNAQFQADHQLAVQLGRESGQPSNTTATSAGTNSKVTNAHREQSDVEKAIQASLSEHQNHQQAERSAVATASAPQSHSTENIPAAATIAVGIPLTDASQEERDRILAKDLQRQEERKETRLLQQQRKVIAQRLRKEPQKDSCVIS